MEDKVTDKINGTVEKIAEVDQGLIEDTQKRLDNLTKPPGSLGRLEELARQIVAMTGQKSPSLKNKVIFTFAADHGVTDEGVSAYPKEVTAQMVYNFLNGGAGINVLAKHAGARVVIADLGVASDLKAEAGLVIKKVNYGTKNMARGPAMTYDEARRSVEAGIEIFEDEYKKGVDLAGTGDMGIGNTTAASAISAVITKRPVEDVTGRGTGIDDLALKNKIKIIKKAIEVNRPDPNDAFDCLSKVGGFEIGGLAGVIIAAASRRVPIVIDGFISGAAALLACKIEPKSRDYMISAHSSVERGHKIVLDYMGLKALLDLDLRLGEGTGSALAMHFAEASIRILTEMATFKSAGVSERS